MESQKIQIRNIPAVSNTALMTLYCRAKDYELKNSILKDKFSYDLYNRIEFDWNLVKKRIRAHDRILTAIRGRKYDQMCKHFLEKYPQGIIVSLGAGLDYRFARIDNGLCTFVEVELPAMLEFKKQLIPTSSRQYLIGKSVLDFSWITQVKELSTILHVPVFFIAEGLIPYFEKSDVFELFRKLSNAFPQSEIFFDVCAEKTVQMMSKHSGIEDWNVKLKCGFDSGHDLETSGCGFKLIGEWLLPDDPDARKGMMKLMWVIPIFVKWLYFLHGKFEA